MPGETFLFCLVFLGQVLLISWFYPRGIVSRRRYVLEHFPPATHPRLYTQPFDYYERRLRRFARLNQVVVVAGIAIVVALLLGKLRGWDGRIVTPWSASGEWDAAIVTPFFLLQVFAVLSLELSSLRHQKALAKSPPPRVRTTDLRPRRLTDFVSPSLLIVAAFINIGYVAFVLYYQRFEFPWFTAGGNIFGIGLMLLMSAVAIAFVLRGPKADPYAAERDRRNGMRLMVRLAVMMCIAFPVLIAAQLAIKIFEPEFLEPVIASLYCQAMALALWWPLYGHRVDEVDYDVYRADAGDTPNGVSATIRSG